MTGKKAYRFLGFLTVILAILIAAMSCAPPEVQEVRATRLAQFAEEQEVAVQECSEEELMVRVGYNAQVYRTVDAQYQNVCYILIGLDKGSLFCLPLKDAQ